MTVQPSQMVWPSRVTPEQLEELRKQLRCKIEARSQSRTGNDGQKQREVLVCGGGACVASGSENLAGLFREELLRAGLDGDVAVVCVGCIGLCSAGPLVVVSPDGICYSRVTSDSIRAIVRDHLSEGGRPVQDLELKETTASGRLLRGRDVSFFARQRRVALRNCGLVDPYRIEEYIARDGYLALERVLTKQSRQDVLDLLKQSGLRGRGGAGFPTGLKWQIVRDELGEGKVVVCNADEGDPGAFMDRSLLEGDPHSVIEGMAIGAYTVGARDGIVYVRAEYALAVERLEHALAQAKRCGLLGANILGFDFELELTLHVGGGAFVCGEETALMNSLEGRRGSPRPRPPFPSQAGLNRKPTLINNVETWAHVPPIIVKGAKWYSGIGTPRSRGTKVFALSGAVRNAGLVEVPMGTALREFVENIGGGIRGNRKLKGALTGGPTGGCIPADQVDRPLDYDSLLELGAMMGSGGLVVIDNTTCAVDLARYFLEFAVDESCGKCASCRVGTRLMLDILHGIVNGRGSLEDLARLEELADHIRDTSLCGLGQTAPNPVLSTLRHFRDEYESHIQEKRCPARQCRSLLTYSIRETLCDGCELCLEACPAQAIAWEPGLVFQIDNQLCTRCGACLTVCPRSAVIAS